MRPQSSAVFNSLVAFSRPIREVLSPISSKEDAPSVQPPPDSERRGPGREKNVGSAFGGQNEGRGWAAWACSQAGNGQRTVKTLTHILVEGIGGKERHVSCVPRCPQGLPPRQRGGQGVTKKEGPSGTNTAAETASAESFSAPPLTHPQQQRRRRQQREAEQDPARGVSGI